MSFQGSYALKFTGKTRSGNPDSGTGVITANGAGKVTGGKLTENKNGTVCQFGLSGTYTVNPNGTGTLNLTGSPSTISCSLHSMTSSVLFDMGKGVAAVNTMGGVAIGELTKQ